MRERERVRAWFAGEISAPDLDALSAESIENREAMQRYIDQVDRHLQPTTRSIMQSYSEREIFTREEIEFMRRATRCVSCVRMPEGVEYRCHEIARAVALALGMRSGAVVVDGVYEGCDHSWIVLPSGNVLDPYAVARLPMVQLVDVRSVTLQRRQYIQQAKRDDIDFDLVLVLAEQMRSAL